VTDAKDRSRRRLRLVSLAIALGGIERVASAVGGAVRVSLMVWGLSAKDYGLYVAIFGIVNTATLLDFGLHYGVLTAVARASGKDDADEVRSTISTGFTLYTIVSTVSALVLVPLTILAPLEWVFGLKPDQVQVARAVTVIGFGSLLLSMPTKVAISATTGLQEGYLASAFRTTSTILQLAVLGLVVVFWRGALLPIVVASTLLDLALSGGFAAWVLRFRDDRTRISWGAVKRRLVAPLLGSGAVFFTSNLASLFRRSLSAVWVSHALGTAAVPRFSIPFALFTIALTFTDLAAGSLLAPYGEASAREDWDWVRRAFRTGVSATLAGALLFAILGGVHGVSVVHLWTPSAPAPSKALCWWFAAWLVSQAFTNSSVTLLNGLHKQRIVMWAGLAEGVLTFVGTWLVVRHFGVEGVAAVMAGAGAIGAIALTFVAVPAVTAGRVSFTASRLARLGIAAAAATAFAFLLEPALVGQRTIVHVLAGAPPVAALFVALCWRGVLSDTERARAKAWLAARRRRAA